MDPKRFIFSLWMVSLWGLNLPSPPGFGQEERHSFIVEEADATLALRLFAEEQGLGLVGRDLPGARRKVTFSFATLEEGLSFLAEAYGIEATLWRNLILAEPVESPKDLPRRLRSSIPPQTATLLFRGPDDGTVEAEGFTWVIEAVRVLRENRAEGRGILEKAAYWMAAPELNSLLRQWDCLQRGVTRALIIGRNTVWGRRLIWREEDPCEQHLVLVAPASGLKEGEEPLSLSFHAPQYDRFARALAEERGLISLGEYKRRLVAAAKVGEGPLLDLPAYEMPITLTVEGEKAWAEALAHLSQMCRPVQWNKALSPGRFSVVVENVEAGTLLIALALLARGVLLDDPEGLMIDIPVTVMEKLTVALPLSWRTWASSTTVERDLAKQRLVKQLWPSLSLGGERRNTHPPLPISALEPAPRALVRALLEVSLASLYRRWTENLPDRSGRVPLWLYESEELGWYELAAPGRSEFLMGELYAPLKGINRER